MTQSISVKIYKGSDSDYYLVDATEPDQGATGDGLSVKDIVDSVGSTANATMIFGHTGTGNTTTYTFGTSEAIPNNFHIIVEAGAQISVTTGVTVTCNAAFTANERIKCIALSGTGRLYFTQSSISVAYPEWWGATVNTGTNASTAINDAIDDLQSGEIRFGPGRYDIGTTTISVTGTGISLVGSGMGATNIQIDNAGGAVVSFGTAAGVVAADCCIRDMKLSRDTGTPGAGAIGLQGTMFTNCRAENLHITDNLYGMEFRSETDFTNASRGFIVEGCFVEEANSAYVHISDAYGIHFSNCFFGAGAKLGTEDLSVDYCILIQDTADAMKFINCHIYPSDAAASTTATGFYIGAYTGTNTSLQIIGSRIDNVLDAMNYAGAEQIDVTMVGCHIEDDIKINGSAANVTIVGNYLEASPTLTGTFIERIVANNVGTVTTYTASGAISSCDSKAELNQASSALAMTIAAPITEQWLIITQTDAGTQGHTVTLTAGTWDGTNNIATFNAQRETLILYGVSFDRFVIVENIGGVSFS